MFKLNCNLLIFTHFLMNIFEYLVISLAEDTILSYIVLLYSYSYPYQLSC